MLFSINRILLAADGFVLYFLLLFVVLAFIYRMKSKVKSFVFFLSLYFHSMKMNNNSLSFFLSFCIAVYIFIFRSYKCFVLFILFFCLPHSFHSLQKGKIFFQLRVCGPKQQ